MSGLQSAVFDMCKAYNQQNTSEMCTCPQENANFEKALKGVTLLYLEGKKKNQWIEQG